MQGFFGKQGNYQFIQMYMFCWVSSLNDSLFRLVICKFQQEFALWKVNKVCKFKEAESNTRTYFCL